MKSKLNQEEIKQFVLSAVHFVAPEINLKDIKPDLPLRDQVDIDSIDFVRFVIRMHETLGVDVPESDYPKLTTLDTCLNYFFTKLNQ